ncbi:MAG: hypothetical protein HIU85_20070 [Proteobacteria bacterium]|nr:hypothetical protein [Pseudomonadota bacterium]
MKTLFRATADFMAHVRRDLERPHAFAHERVGFIAVRAAAGHEHLVLLAERYYSVDDQDYVPDPTVGALIGQEALRKALEIALLKSVGMFHVHAHFFPGRLWFSPIDLREQTQFVPDFFSACGNMPHGALVLNHTDAAGRVWLSRTRIATIDEFNTVGTNVTVERALSSSGVDFYA